MTKESPRVSFVSIDCLKGILIIFVIIGHILPGSLRENVWRYIIYSFHMPLFLGISGFLISRNSIRNQKVEYLLRKYWSRMILPWLVAFLFFTPVVLIGKDAFSVKEVCFMFLFPSHHLWFIPALFGMVLITFYIEKFEIQYVWVIALSLSFTLLWETIYFENSIWGGPEILKWIGDKRLYLFFIFFFWGYILRNSPNIVLKKWNIGYFVLFVFLVSILRLGNFYYYYPELLSVLCWLFLNILLIYIFAIGVEKIKFPFAETLLSIGVYSLPIYLWHFLPIIIMRMLNIDGQYPIWFYCIGGISQIFLFNLVRKLRNNKTGKRLLLGLSEKVNMRSHWQTES